MCDASRAPEGGPLLARGLTVPVNPRNMGDNQLTWCLTLKVARRGARPRAVSLEERAVTRLFGAFRRICPSRIANRSSLAAAAAAAVVLGAFSAAFAPSLEAQAGQEPVNAFDMVIFDGSREQFWSPYDVGFFGYSELGVLLREEGFLVSEVNLPVTFSLQVEPRGSVFVMGPATGQKYTAKEIKAVEDYVNNGGGLLILAEGGQDGDNFQNPLASKFGMLLTNRTVVDEAGAAGGTAGQWIRARSGHFGIDSVSVPIAVQMMLAKSAFPILAAYDSAKPSGAVIGAAAERGKGRVACIGDSQFLVNGGQARIGIDSGRNREFARALFNWLAGREEAPSCRIVPEYTVVTGRTVKVRIRVDGTADLKVHIDGGFIDPEEVRGATGELTFTAQLERDGSIEFVGSDGSRKTILTLLSPIGGIGARLILDVRGYGPDVCDPLNGLTRFAGLMRDKGFWVWGIEDGVVNVDGAYGVMIINPVRSEGHVYTGNLKRESLRWVFINEPYTTVGVRNPVGQWFRDQGFTDREVPVHALTSQYEMRFLPYVVFEPDIAKTLGRHHTFPELLFGTEKTHSFRSAAVEAVGGTARLLGSRSAWGLEGGLGLRPELTGTAPAKNDLSTTPAVVAISLSGTALAIGDLQLLSTQNIIRRGNWSVALELADWMAGIEFEIPGAEGR